MNTVSSDGQSRTGSQQPTIELTSSDDEEGTRKSKRKNKKRDLDKSKSETRQKENSPKSRITYFEESEDDEFEFCKAKTNRRMPSRKARPSKLKLSGSDDDEPSIKKTPSRRCKLKQNAPEKENDESNSEELLLPLSSKRTRNAVEKEIEDDSSSDELVLPLSSKKWTQGNDQSASTAGSVTPLKTRTNGTTNASPRVSSRKCSVLSVDDKVRQSNAGISRVFNALVAIERMDLGVETSNGSCAKSPSKRLLDSPASAKRTSRRNLEDVFEANSNDSDIENDSTADKLRHSQRAHSQSKTPSKRSSREIGTPATKKTPAKMEALRSADALSKADATPEKGSTPGKHAAKSTRVTPAKGTTPSKSTTPAKPSSVVIPVSSSEDEEELATPLKSKRSTRSKQNLPPKVETPLRRSSRTPMKTVTPARRSTRVSMSPSTPSLRQKVLLANTPRSSLPPLKDETESEDEFVTPRKTPKTAKKKLDLTPSTPSSCRKVGHGFLSPVVQEREKRGASTPSSALGIARAQLQVSTLPTSLPCRENEFTNIKNFIFRKLQDGIGGCMYISGVPGTGKTATVHTVVRSLQKMAEDHEIAAFDFVEVNGLRLTEPRQAYVRIWQGLTKEKLTPDQSLKNLETRFNGKPKRCTVLLVDELDYLCNRRQDVIYNILDWTTKRYSKLVVLTIANTMDLPERTLKGKVTSRMGLTRLGFQSYNFHQLEQIVLNRLDGCKAFHPDAVQLVARKVAAVSGDARRALDICRRSTEILELEGRTNVSVLDIQKVLTQIFAGSRVQAVKNCSVMAKLVLRAIRDEVLRTGVEETTVAFIHPQLVSICALDGKREPTISDLLAICSNLAEYGLIFAEKGRKDINRKISLNVGTDDIHYAIDC